MLSQAAAISGAQQMVNILPIAQQGEAILSLRASLVGSSEWNSPWLQALVAAMQDTMQAANGVGIAAPQVFVSKRIIIVASRPNARYPDAPEMQPIVMFNPEILDYSTQRCWGEEGCLSVPSQRGSVERALSVHLQYQMVSGELVETQLTGFVARIVQHEIDHLDGVLFIDRLSTL
jgi:peptide deformylase